MINLSGTAEEIMGLTIAIKISTRNKFLIIKRSGKKKTMKIILMVTEVYTKIKTRKIKGHKQ